MFFPEEQVHDGGGVHMSEEERDKARLGLDVVDDLEAGELVGVPILPTPREQTTVRQQQHKHHKKENNWG